MKRLVLSLLLTTPGMSFAADSFECKFNDHVTRVSLDRAERLLTVAWEDGIKDTGYYTEREVGSAEFTEYYLFNDRTEAYYLRLWHKGDVVDFRYCVDCAVYTCARTSGDGVNLEPQG